MTTNVRVNVQMVLQLEHDGPTEGLDSVMYDRLLSGVQTDPNLARKLSDALVMGLQLHETDVGWVDENVSYRANAILEVILMQVVEVTEGEREQHGTSYHVREN